MRKNRIVKNGFLEQASNRKKLGFYDFPYDSKLSFVPLIRHWKKKLTSPHIGVSLLAKEIVLRLDNCLEFLAPVNDVKLLEEHWDFVELIAAGLIPMAFEREQLILLVKPFEVNGFYQSPALQKLIKSDDLVFTVNKNPRLVRNTLIIRACSMILNTFYGEDLWVDLPIIFIAQTADGSTERHFKAYLNIDFVEIKKLRPLKAISRQQINRLLSNLEDLDFWLECIPPANFQFHGLVKIQFQEVTNEEVLSNMKRKLLERDAVVRTKNIKALEKELTYYFRLPSLRLGLSAVDFPADQQSFHHYKIHHHLLATQYDYLLDKQFGDSIYYQACRNMKVMVAEDLRNWESVGPLEQAVLDLGLESLIVVPLVNVKGQVIGILELAAPKANALNGFNALLIDEIAPLFRTALVRRRYEIDNEIDTIIQEYYTTLHPSIEWKFIEKALALSERIKSEGDKAIAEPIVFKNVYALYGQGDIVNSTIERNRAVQTDLIQNLQLVLALLKEVPQQGFPILQQYQNRIRAELEQQAKQSISNDELRILDYLKKSIHPFFGQLVEQFPQLKPKFEAYFAQLDPDLQIIYRQRSAYEQSVAMINEHISKLLKKAQKKAQQIIPHYFEQYITDGVQFDMYVGQSLLRDAHFNYLQLRSLRLWQLIVLCQTTRTVQHIRAELPVPLQTAELLLVHSVPISIRFRMDEKRFDVDGVSNVRYAVLKKRIDKAFVENTNERLTQSGKIAIVYLQDAERSEYLEYLDYLRAEGYLAGEIEDLALHPMQGVEGLRALRFTVNTSPDLATEFKDTWLDF